MPKSNKTSSYRKYRKETSDFSSESELDQRCRRKNSNDEYMTRKKKARRTKSSTRSSESEKYNKNNKQYTNNCNRTNRSPSSESSSAEKSVKLLKRLEDKRIKEAVGRKRRKEQMKANETPEEKRARRLQEKQCKEKKRRERMGWDNEYQHYTNQDNPFGDAHLTSTFVWKKKLEKQGLQNVDSETVEALNRRKQLENKAELEKVKKRRIERELERQNREEETVLLLRSREAAQFEEWERQEDKFHLEQARLRSKIRIHDGRAKPIDLLAQYITNSNLEETIEMQMHEPYTYLNGLESKDLDDLLVDIKVYIELEKGNNSDFWEDMTVIVEDELQKLRKLELDGEYHAKVGRREGIHQSVAKDVTEVFRKKSTSQLEKLKKEIETKISGKIDGVDISYWESLLSQLKAHMARARLMDKHQENLRYKLELLKTEPPPSLQLETNEELTENNAEKNNQSSVKQFYNHDSKDLTAIQSPLENDEVENILENCCQSYDDGCYSPKYLAPIDLDNNIEIFSTQNDEEKLEYMRNQLIQQNAEEDAITREEMIMKKEARRGMEGDEAEFSVETKVDSQVYLWSDKYRPRKPRYFNRVHTGFEWNKYNQTHYDMDNPPPKIVQGYKFNIFYPDLIDKSCTPQYFLTPCNDNKDFAVLRFHAGPPYEDIAFKIVNREWEFSYKRGFRCQFHNNIFQLWFHFKRYRYRR